ncbi:unnamed protein product, partial [Ixodes pacificus]
TSNATGATIVDKKIPPTPASNFAQVSGDAREVMPASLLWAVDSGGRVSTLSTGGARWQELPYSGIDLKRVSALRSCAWGVASDHQVYVFVPQGDVPIRVPEVTYENQRWNPREGFCSRLLPTDRPSWSSRDGLVARSKESIRLPSSGWQWEGCWYIEDNLDGQPLGSEGWSYCVDFPFTYTLEKKWNSMVRRRKWIRHRRYVATDRWAKIEGVHSDPIAEPFVDIAVGGNEVPGGDPDRVVVWAVTVQGRVMFRNHVTRLCPEGTSWSHVPVPESSEVTQVSVGPTGLTWAVAWNGSALVRLGVSRENYAGSDWAGVAAPENDDKLLQVAVGHNTLWAVGRSGTVWFRKGIHGDDLGCRASVTGSGWVKMVGEMAMISVGPNDQVWGITRDDRRLTLRTGVTLHEACGREWKEIVAPFGSAPSRSSSLTSLASLGSLRLSSSPAAPMQPTTVTTTLVETSDAKGFTFERKAVSLQGSPSGSLGEVGSPAKRDWVDSIAERPLIHSSSGDLVDCAGVILSGDWSASRELIGSVMWSWVSGTACTIDYPISVPAWFSPTGSRHNSGGQKEAAAWRRTVLARLKDRRKKETEDYPNYDSAVEKTTWVKTAVVLLWRDTPPCQWVRCKLELERHSSESEDCDGSAILRLLYSHGGSDKKMVINMADVVSVSDVSDRERRMAGIYTEMMNSKGTFVKVAFGSDREFEDWLAALNVATCETRGVTGAARPSSTWGISLRGDVFVHDSDAADESTRPSDLFWRHLGGGHFRVVESCPLGVTWALGHDNTAWAYTGGYGGGVFRGMTGHNEKVGPMTDVKSVHIYENQRWNPFSGFAARGLLTDRYMWSDRSGLVECTKEGTRLDSAHWHWVSDWAVDYRAPGGVDGDGWQYARDFPFTYHAHKGMTDYVRRRRWFRLCKLHTTGPWVEVEPMALRDVSLQTDCRSGPIALWAVSYNGEAVYRKGVSQDCPKGTSWVHVAAEQQFESISLGAGHRLWAVGRDGSAYFRNGITLNNPTGSAWFHVEPPPGGSPLVQVSVGQTAVCAVDASGKLWRRLEVMEFFPEGTEWALVSANVRSVSVGPSDQIWAVVDVVLNRRNILHRVLARREGVTMDNPIGTHWESGFGVSSIHLPL